MSTTTDSDTASVDSSVAYQLLEADAQTLRIEEFVQVLEWIGITEDVDLEGISMEIAEDLTQLRNMTPEQMRFGMATLNKSRIGDGGETIPMKVISRFEMVLHWVQDFYRCDMIPSLDRMHDDQAAFLSELDSAIQRADIRKHLISHSSELIKQTDPGLLKGNQNWVTWLESQENHLAVCLGLNGVPLSYLIRKTEVGNKEADFESFNEKAIACAPLTGPSFEADAATLHQKFVAWTANQTSLQFIKKDAHKNNGRIDYINLLAHYDGQGSKELRLKKAKHLHDSLHYKNERILTFDSFLAKIEEMTNIYRECGQEMYDEQKLTFLLDNIQTNELVADISTLRSQKTKGECTYKYAANFLAARAATFTGKSDNTRGLSAVHNDGGGPCPLKGIYKDDGTIFTDKYHPPSRYYALSKEEKTKLYKERLDKGLVSGGYGGKKGGKSKFHNKDNPNKKMNNRLVASLNKEVKKMKRKVSLLQSKSSYNGDDEGDGQDDEPDDQAGNAFGGRAEKQKKKKG